MMYNPQLDTFLQVASLGSFSKAAEAMFITAPAVIKQINLLEESLGVKLFVRTHRGLRLTEAGKSMYGDAKRIIQDCNEAVVRARNAMQDSENIARIGTSPMTPGQFVLKLWPAIQEQCPDIKFQLVPFENTPQNARNILRNLGQNIDIVPGAFDQNFLQSRKCAGLELIQAPIRCAVSIYHRLAEKNSLTIQDFYGPPPRVDEQLACTPADELLSLEVLQPQNIRDTLHAYQLAKRRNGVLFLWPAETTGKLV